MKTLTDTELLQAIADHDADMQEFIDHLWRIVTRVVQDSQGLDTREKYELVRDVLIAKYGPAPDDA